MSEASFASLNPTLLARKGGAKPAMRPQLAPLPETVADEELEDLGWNDMGQDDGVEADTGADIVPISSDAAKTAEDEPSSPIVKKQQKKIEESILAEVAKPKTKAVKAGRRAAFTLRLDEDRHLKLRLAATMQGKSAQAVVTQALDAMLDQIEDLDALAERMKRN